jgi:hypothetical protein
VDTPLEIVTESGEQARLLREWLGAEDDLRGRLSIRAQAPAGGELGVGADVLLAVLAPGGAAVTLIAGVFAWLQSRTSPVRVRMVRPDGSEVEIETAVVGRIPAAELPSVVTGLAGWAAGGPLDEAAQRALPPAETGGPATNSAGGSG